MSEGRGLKRQLTQEMVLNPLTRVRVLSDIGSSVRVDKAVPVKRYFRSGSEMERQARVYYSERQLDKAFVLYNKFATLFLEKLPKVHPDYSKPEYKQDRAKIKKLLKEAFPRAEELKKKLTIQFEAERDALERKLAEEAESNQREEQRRAEELRQRDQAERRRREEEERKERERADELAAFLAGSVGSSAFGGSSSEPRSGGAGTEEQNATAAPSSISYDNDISPEPKPVSETGQAGLTMGGEGEGDLEQMSSAMGALDVGVPSNTRPEGISLTATNAELAQVLPPAYEGPPATREDLTTQQASYLSPGTAQTPLSSVRTYQSIFSGPVSPSQTPQTPTYAGPPPPPTNPYYVSAGGQGAQIPPGGPGTQYPPYYTPGPPHPQPQYVAGQYASQFSTASSGSWGSVELPAPSYHMLPPSTATPSQAIEEEEEEESRGPPSVDRSKKPTYNALSTSIGGGYRMIYVPEDISRRFEEAASTNTRQNTETCGILAGKLSQNKLHITHVILPKQRGGPDSCETLCEEELFDVQDQHDLITLGWIHTHPSQTAFMSSVDLHTHCSYQIMLDEAIAIVCAPRYSQVGMYMLTEPYGLDYITHCEEEGFHSHAKTPPLYEECKHVVFSSQSTVKIVDLR